MQTGPNLLVRGTVPLKGAYSIMTGCGHNGLWMQQLRAKPYTFAKLHVYILHMQNYMFCTKYLLLHMQYILYTCAKHIVLYGSV